MEILQLDSNTLIHKIVSHVQETDSITVAFIDPNGIDIHLDTIAKLSSFRRVDLIINFSISDLKRNIETYTGANDKANKFFGTSDWPRDSRKWLKFYRSKLARMGFRGIELDNERVISIRAPNGAVIYYLLYASKRDLGLRFWRDTKKKIEGPDILTP